jgi:hypothetical protein
VDEDDEAFPVSPRQGSIATEIRLPAGRGRFSVAAAHI